MANTFYYGSCNSAAESTVKQVVIQGLPAEIRDESFLQLGDMISVTFNNGNSVEHPTLKIYNGSLDAEIAISEDNGYFIKAQRLNGSIKEAWNSGDTCNIFYTKVNNTYYWTLANNGIASNSSYGKVKIANDINNISETDAATTAITVQAARELIAAQPIGRLEYNDTVSSSNKRQIGSLTFTNGNESSNIPVYTFPEPVQVSHTHELENDGEGDDNGKFLTRKLDTTISFAGPAKGITIYDEENEVEHLVYEAADVNGDATLKSLNDFNIETANDFNIETANDLNIEVTNDLKVQTNQDLIVNALGTMNVRAQNIMGLYGSDVILDHDIQYLLDVIVDSETGVITGTDKDLYEAIQNLGWNDIL